jgi:hypothetical protein
MNTCIYISNYGEYHFLFIYYRTKFLCCCQYIQTLYRVNAQQVKKVLLHSEKKYIILEFQFRLAKFVI